MRFDASYWQKEANQCCQVKQHDCTLTMSKIELCSHSIVWHSFRDKQQNVSRLRQPIVKD